MKEEGKAAGRVDGAETDAIKPYDVLEHTSHREGFSLLKIIYRP